MHERQKAGSGLPALPSTGLTPNCGCFVSPLEGGCRELAELQRRAKM